MAVSGGTWILTEHAKHPGGVRCVKKVTLPLPPPHTHKLAFPTHEVQPQTT